MRVWKLTKASALAVVACCVGGGAALAVLTPDGSYIDPMWWIRAIAWWSIISAPFAMAIGLPQGLVLHVIFNKLHWHGLAHYIGVAMFITLTSSLFAVLIFHLGNVLYYGAIFLASLFGSVTFWIVDRPDRVSGP